jgi:hypothetical protein
MEVGSHGAPDRSPSLGDAAIGAQVDLLVLHRPPESRSTKTLSRQAPLPSLLMAILTSFSALMKAMLVNCEPLVGNEDLRPAVAVERFFQGFDAEVGRQRDR